MSISEKVTQLLEGVLTQDELRLIEDFVDNYVGTSEEGYMQNNDYLAIHRDEIKRIWRKMKNAKVFGTFTSLVYPHCDKGILFLFDN